MRGEEKKKKKKKKKKKERRAIEFCWIAKDTSTIYLAIRTIAMKRRVQRPVTGFALVALLMVSLITRSRNNHDDDPGNCMYISIFSL